LLLNPHDESLARGEPLRTTGSRACFVKLGRTLPVPWQFGSPATGGEGQAIEDGEGDQQFCRHNNLGFCPETVGFGATKHVYIGSYFDYIIRVASGKLT